MTLALIRKSQSLHFAEFFELNITKSSHRKPFVCKLIRPLMMKKKEKSVFPSSTEEEVYVYILLKQMGCSGKEALVFSKSLLKMFSAPVLDQIDAKHAQLQAKLEAKLDAHKSEINHLRWYISIGVAVIGGLLATVIAMIA